MTESMSMVNTQGNALAQQNTNSVGTAARSEAEIKAAIFVAKTYPRNETNAFSNLLKSIDRESFAKIAAYSFPRAGKAVEGPSINFAKEFARLWGNVQYGATIVFDDGEDIIIEGWAWDVETNAKTSGQASFKNLIYRKTGGWIKPDERDKRELVNKHSAIAIRNALLSLLPRDMVDDAMRAVKKNLINKVNKEDPKIAAAKATKFFEEKGVTIENLEVFLEMPQEKWMAEEIVGLQGLAQSIVDGNTSVHEIKKLKKNPEPEAVNVGSVIAGAKIKDETDKPKTVKPASAYVTDAEGRAVDGQGKLI